MAKVKIKDQPDLVKEGGVVSNVNQEAFIAYHRQRQLAKEKEQKVADLEDKVATLEKLVQDLLNAQGK